MSTEFIDVTEFVGCPCKADEMVDVKLANGQQLRYRQAGRLNWQKWLGEKDIVLYRPSVGPRKKKTPTA